MTITEEMIEAAALAMVRSQMPSEYPEAGNWDAVSDHTKTTYFQLARAALTAVLPMLDGWQDINTAPKDGPEIWAFNAEWSVPMQMLFWDGTKWNDYSGDSYQGNFPTHWRPLPPPPKGDGT